MNTKYFSALFIAASVWMLIPGMVKGQTWTQRATFPGGGRQYCTSFAVGGKGYIGFGNNNMVNDLWEYEPGTNSWTQKASIPGTGGRSEMVSFVVGSKAYIGLGLGSGGTSNYFWEYNPATDTWTRMADFPGVWMRLPATFSVGDKCYIASGSGANGMLDFWEYDVPSNTWTQKNNLPLAVKRYAGLGFAIGDKGYIGIGVDTMSNVVKDFWEYDPVNDTWTRKADFGGGLRVNSVGFASINKGYITTGHNNQGSFYNDLWEYDPVSDMWTQKANYPGGQRFAGAGFAIGCSVYVGVGSDAGFTMHNDFWEFTACSALPFTATVTPVHLTCHGDRTGQATANPVGGVLPYTYKWQHSNQTAKTITGLAAGTYRVTITDGNSDTATASVTLVEPAPVVVLASLDTAICSGDSVILSATGAATYTWTPGAGLNTTTGGTVTARPATSTTYYIEGTLSGCTGIDSVIVTINAVTLPAITLSDSLICSGDSTQVCAPAGYSTYLWNTGETSLCIEAKVAGGFWVTVSNSAGCTTESPHKQVNVYPVSPVSVVVLGDTLTSYGAVAYQWYFNNSVIPGATTEIHIARQTGNYSVEILDSNGCFIRSAEFTIVVNAVNELNADRGVVVYPNPARNEVMIHAGNCLLNGFSIYNALGQQVKYVNLSGAGYTVVKADTEGLPAGLYEVLILIEQQTVTRKLLIH